MYILKIQYIYLWFGNSQIQLFEIWFSWHAMLMKPNTIIDHFIDIVTSETVNNAIIRFLDPSEIVWNHCYRWRCTKKQIFIMSTNIFFQTTEKTWGLENVLFQPILNIGNWIFGRFGSKINEESSVQKNVKPRINKTGTCSPRHWECFILWITRIKWWRIHYFGNFYSNQWIDILISMLSKHVFFLSK